MKKEKKIKPILKWAGGKSSELDVIHKNMPTEFNNFYEPFVGGGAVWLSIDTSHKMFVNDFSEELINLYNNIKTENKLFYTFINSFNNLWLLFNKIIKDEEHLLVSGYKEYKINRDTSTLKSCIELIMSKHKEELSNHIEELQLNSMKDYFSISKIINNIQLKLIKLTKTEDKRGSLPESDYILNIATIFKNALYLELRALYNKAVLDKTYDKGLKAAIYYLIRDLCYSGMFRYNSKGEFNVPYGGMSYNQKNYNTKIKLMQNSLLLNHLNNSIINNNDFYDFFSKYKPQQDDFIFLDPPYDSEFSSYEGNSFTREDQQRLASYLINECTAKWMVVIKNTDYIYSIYNKDGVNIFRFDKKYAVSFMDRNNREVTHLLITNYDI